MATLIHLNGPTGVGKSTIAARYAADHPGVLNLDADQIVRLIGGWRDNFFATVNLVRPLAITMATTHLASGHDVVMPQLVTDRGQRDRFADAAASVGAEYREIVLLAPREVSISRFRERDHHIDHVVEAMGGATLIHRIYDHLTAYLAAEAVIETGGHGPEATVAEGHGPEVIQSGEHEPEATYQALLAALGELSTDRPVVG